MQIDWRNLPPLSTLKAFDATARMGGYSAAARALNVTPAAIAQQVRKLETEIGAALVRREGRGLTLTQPGRQLATALRDGFGTIATGFEDIKKQEATRGVRVSTTHFFADAVILPHLSDFWARHPEVQVTFSPEGSLKPIDFENFDICVRGNNIGATWPGYNVRRLLASKIVVAAAPSLLAANDGDLSKCPWLHDRGLGEDTMREFVTSVGFDFDRIEIVDPGSARFEIEAAVMGLGLIVGPEIIGRRHFENGTLVIVETPLNATGVYSSITPKGPLSEPAQNFLDWLIEVSAGEATATT